MKRVSFLKAIQRGWFVFLLGPVAISDVRAATDIHDALDRAVTPTNDVLADTEDHLSWIVENQFSYDDNLFRLPSSITDVRALVGPGAARQDHIDTTSIGASGQWSPGTQLIKTDIRVGRNVFSRNENLNNISDDASVAWNWQLGSVLSGVLGATHNKFLASYVNTSFYGRNLFERTEYVGSLRYQVGPHWAVFGGVNQASGGLTAAASRSNDSRSTTGEVGSEFATAVDNTFGVAYRFKDTHYPNDSILNGIAFQPDYREDTLRGLAKYKFSDKTSIDASGGYLRRKYSDVEIASFSGEIWRVSLTWLPTEKVQLLLGAWRDLNAYLNAQTDYYVSKGGSVAPTWFITEKISLSGEASFDSQNYIGSNATTVANGSRRDTVSAQKATLLYKPFRALSLDLSYRLERRNSNQARLSYDDRIASAEVTLKF